MPKESVGRGGEVREGKVEDEERKGQQNTGDPPPPKKSLLAFPTVTGFVPGLTGLGQGWW